MVAVAGLIGFALAALLFGIVFTGNSDTIDAGAARFDADRAASTVPETSTVPAAVVGNDVTTTAIVDDGNQPAVVEETVTTVAIETTTTTIPSTITTVPETSTTAAPVEAETPTTVAAPAPPSGSDAAFQQQILELTNAERAAAGCNPVVLNPTLNSVADAHSEDMAVNDYFDHTGLNGSQPWDRVAAAGYAAQGSGENIAKGYSSPADAVAGWMDSPGHRRNMLDCQWTELGVGYAEGSSTSGNIRPLYWTQVFAVPR